MKKLLISYMFLLLFSIKPLKGTKYPWLEQKLSNSQLAIVIAGTSIGLMHLIKTHYPNMPCLEELVGYHLLGLPRKPESVFNPENLCHEADDNDTETDGFAISFSTPHVRKKE